uniref:Uncharacterized protein n=1 Tax=Populus trichocarpa TaxID=3694 RepID=A0A2K1X2G7_POPTR
MPDTRVLAEQQIWAAVTDGAKNQAFNCTNGDVFTWMSLWKVLFEVFDVGFVAYEESDEKFDWLGMMRGKGKMWDEIVEKFQHVCSMIKSREFGFLGYADTLKSIQMWVGRLRAMKMIPRR